MVASFIDGRIRIRDVAFISRSLACDVQGALLENKGITRASVNRRTGSLLVIYDTAKMNGETIVGLIAAYLKDGEGAAGTEGRRSKPGLPKTCRGSLLGGCRGGLRGMSLSECLPHRPRAFSARSLTRKEEDGRWRL